MFGWRGPKSRMRRGKAGNAAASTPTGTTTSGLGRKMLRTRKSADIGQTMVTIASTVALEAALMWPPLPCMTSAATSWNAAG